MYFEIASSFLIRELSVLLKIVENFYYFPYSIQSLHMQLF